MVRVEKPRKRQIRANELIDEISTVDTLISRAKDWRVRKALNNLHKLLMREYQIVAGDIW